MQRKRVCSILCSAAALALTSGLITACATMGETQVVRAKPGEQIKLATRRLTESQYRHAIEHALGAGIAINARFEPERREEGLLAVGSTHLSLSSSGFEQYFAMAQSISGQALAPRRRAQTVQCAPADATKPDDACARAFVTHYGEKLFRRPLTEPEIAARVATAARGAQGGDFYKGLELALASMLVAPEFLFRVEVAEADPDNRGRLRLDGYTKAARLSFLFWDAPPDAELVASARSGEIHSEAGLRKQIERLAASPRLQDGARAFFTDMLQFDQYESLTKDAATYPKFSQAVADSSREQTLRTVVDHLVARAGDYRDLFTSNATFLNRHLAAVYNVSFRSNEEWAPYTFADSAERAGILTHISFLSLFSHPAASSPTRRGVKIHEIFMCEETPEPPPDVDFSKVQALDEGTVRIRLLAHMENEGCASCHQLSDPPGLALEHFDGLGQSRRFENGQLIDVSAEVEGTRFVGAPGLGRFLHDDSRIPRCLVRNVFAYGVGRAVDWTTDTGFVERQTSAFAEAGYRFAPLLTQVATSPEFFEVRVPEGARPISPGAMTIASSQTSRGGNP